MAAVIEGRSVVIVLLDSFGKYTRVADAQRIKTWMANTLQPALPGVDSLALPADLSRSHRGRREH